MLCEISLPRFDNRSLRRSFWSRAGPAVCALIGARPCTESNVEAFPHRHQRRFSRSQNSRSAAARRTLIALVGLGLIVVLAAAALLYDHSRRNTIAAGVTAGGVNLGGLSVDQAFLRVRDRVVAPLQRPVRVVAAGHSFDLTPAAAGVSVNAKAIADQALAVSRQGSIFTRVFRGLTGGHVNRAIPLRVNYSHAAVRSLVAQVAAAANLPAQDATVKPSATTLTEVASHDGRLVNARALGSEVEHALADPNYSHSIIAPMRVAHPHVTTTQLAAKYPAYIIVDRGGFTLRFFQHLKLVDSYPIAVGMQGLETPAGLYNIQWKQVNPPWYVPNDSWAGALAGKVIPPGPQDPLKARFMAFNGGAGIHGIDPSEYGTIGHDASHGCVRMRIPDVISLYSRAPVGTPVFVA
jgi:lipoprotein-anchoring transpeptidase ErfK/SrfK